MSPYTITPLSSLVSLARFGVRIATEGFKIWSGSRLFIVAEILKAAAVVMVAAFLI